MYPLQYVYQKENNPYYINLNIYRNGFTSKWIYYEFIMKCINFIFLH